MVVRGGGCGWMHAAPALRPLKFEGRPGNQEAPGKTTPANEEARQRPEAHANYEKIGRHGRREANDRRGDVVGPGSEATRFFYTHVPVQNSILLTR